MLPYHEQCIITVHYMRQIYRQIYRLMFLRSRNRCVCVRVTNSPTGCIVSKTLRHQIEYYHVHVTLYKCVCHVTLFVYVTCRNEHVT